MKTCVSATLAECCSYCFSAFSPNIDCCQNTLPKESIYLEQWHILFSFFSTLQCLALVQLIKSWLPTANSINDHAEGQPNAHILFNSLLGKTCSWCIENGGMGAWVLVAIYNHLTPTCSSWRELNDTSTHMDNNGDQATIAWEHRCRSLNKRGCPWHSCNA